MADKVDQLIEQLEKTAQTIRDDATYFDSHPEKRQKLLKAAETLTKTVQQPMEGYLDFLTAMANATIVNLFVKWKVFETIDAAGSISYSDLADKVGADVALITRFTRLLVGTGVLIPSGKDELRLAPDSKVFIPPHPASSLVQFAYDFHCVAAVTMPKYFEKHGRKEPVGRHKTITAYAYGNPDWTVWQHLNSDPAAMSVFMDCMVAMTHMHPMVGSYDFSWVAAEASRSPERALVVDMGGGKGHAIKAISQATPGLVLSRCYVQDLDEIVQEAKATADEDLKQVQFIVADFHVEQPVKDACIYYIRRCLHDYGDDEVMEILEVTRKKMAADSKLLIVEQILDFPPLPFAAAADVLISTIGGKERTMEEFERVVSRAGLKVSQVCRTPDSDVGIIECEIA